MRSLTFSRSSRGRLPQACAWAWVISSMAAVPALTNGQEVRRPAVQRQPRLFDRSGAAYEYGYDPYDGKMESRAYAAQGYSTYAERFYTLPRIEAVPPRLAAQPPTEVYGYVEPEGPTEEFTSGARGAILGYYYDPQTGDLEYGWHEEGTPAARPASREQIRPRLPRNKEELRPPLHYGEPFEQELEQFRGKVIGVTSYTDRTSNRIHLIARIRQPDGTLRAIEMGLFATTTVSEGDWIEGFGPRAVVRGGPVILARYVSVNGVWQGIHESYSPEVRSFAGEILRLRSVPLTGRPGPQTIAEVRVGPGTVETVILGPTSAILEETQFAAGDHIAFWARRGTLDGLPALVATQIDLGTRVLNVNGAGVRSTPEDLLIPVE